MVELSNPAIQLEVAGREAEIYQQWIASISTEHQLLASKSSLDRETIVANRELSDLADRLDRLRELLPEGGTTIEEMERVARELAAKRKLIESLTAQRKTEDGIRKAYVDNMQNSLRNLEATLDHTRRSLEALTVRAPISGQISALDVVNGVLLNMGDPLATIDDVSLIALEAEIDEYYAGVVGIGSPGEVVMNDDNRLRVVVSHMGRSVVDGRFEATLTIEGDQKELPLIVGQTLSVRLTGDVPADVLALRAEEHLDPATRDWVYVVDEGGKRASKRKIRFGRRDGAFVEIIEGVSLGEQVITSSYGEVEADAIRLQ